jgi:hypothetical protein
LRTTHRSLPLVFRIPHTLLIALWLWSFLPVMAKLNLLQSPDSFIIVLVVLAMAELVPSRPFRFCAAFAISVVYMVHYFLPQGEAIFQGVTRLFTDEIQEVPPALHGGILVDPLQTHLFLFVLAILYWFIIYAASRPKTWILYSLLGVVVLALIDGNTPVHPNRAIVLVLLVSLLNLGFIQFATLATHFRLQRTQWLRFFIPFAILVSAVFCTGFLLPKHPAVWANPFVHFENTFQQSDGSSVHMVGYALNNSRLGGSYILDNTPVLSVIAERPSYLRGQSLTVYTGKGWVAADLSGMPDNYEYEYVGGAFSNPEHFAFSHIPEKPLAQTIQVLSDKLETRDLLAGWAISKVDSVSGLPKNATLSMELLGANLNVPDLKVGDSYVVRTEQLQDPYSFLAASTPDYTQTKQELSTEGTDSFNKLPKQGMDYYTQLPPELPSRVHDLAQKVVGNAQTEYEMVTKIRDYLEANYTYTNTGVPVPGKNEDYVDQFLFQSKKGYCNNFSSAMAVMLRTLDIPTRWVTGFTDGQPDLNYKGTRNRYIIRESDAHSWVEVFFPHYGWIPFDSTPNYELDFAPATISSQNPDVSQGVQSKNTKIPLDLPQSMESGSEQPLTFDLSGFLFITLRALILLVVVAGFLIWLFRNKIAMNRALRLWSKDHRDVPTRPIAKLVQSLQGKGIVADGQVTVRDLHVAAKESGIKPQDYVHFVKTIEDTWYGGHTPAPEDRNRLQKTWKAWLSSVLRLRNRK